MKNNKDLTPEEVAHQKKWWAIGNNIIKQMQKNNKHLWEVKKIKQRQPKLKL